jgi:hypothetical protein
LDLVGSVAAGFPAFPLPHSPQIFVSNLKRKFCGFGVGGLLELHNDVVAVTFGWQGGQLSGRCSLKSTGFTHEENS